MKRGAKPQQAGRLPWSADTAAGRRLVAGGRCGIAFVPHSRLLAPHSLVSYYSGLVARVSDVLAQLGERAVRQKNVFSGWGILFGKKSFVIVCQEALLVKCPRAEHDAALATPGVEPFAPGGERPMGTWVVVPADVVADDPELVEWVRRGLRGIR